MCGPAGTWRRSLMRRSLQRGALAAMRMQSLPMGQHIKQSRSSTTIGTTTRGHQTVTGGTMTTETETGIGTETETGIGTGTEGAGDAAGTGARAQMIGIGTGTTGGEGGATAGAGARTQTGARPYCPGPHLLSPAARHM